MTLDTSTVLVREPPGPWTWESNAPPQPTVDVTTFQDRTQDIDPLSTSHLSKTYDTSSLHLNIPTQSSLHHTSTPPICTSPISLVNPSMETATVTNQPQEMFDSSIFLRRNHPPSSFGALVRSKEHDVWDNISSNDPNNPSASSMTLTDASRLPGMRELMARCNDSSGFRRDAAIDLPADVTDTTTTVTVNSLLKSTSALNAFSEIAGASTSINIGAPLAFNPQSNAPLDGATLSSMDMFINSSGVLSMRSPGSGSDKATSPSSLAAFSSRQPEKIEQTPSANGLSTSPTVNVNQFVASQTLLPDGASLSLMEVRTSPKTKDQRKESPSHAKSKKAVVKKSGSTPTSSPSDQKSSQSASHAGNSQGSLTATAAPLDTFTSMALHNPHHGVGGMTNTFGDSTSGWPNQTLESSHPHSDPTATHMNGWMINEHSSSSSTSSSIDFSGNGGGLPLSMMYPPQTHSHDYGSPQSSYMGQNSGNPNTGIGAATQGLLGGNSGFGGHGPSPGMLWAVEQEGEDSESLVVGLNAISDEPDHDGIVDPYYYGLDPRTAAAHAAGAAAGNMNAHGGNTGNQTGPETHPNMFYPPTPISSSSSSSTPSSSQYFPKPHGKHPYPNMGYPTMPPHFHTGNGNENPYHHPPYFGYGLPPFPQHPSHPIDMHHMDHFNTLNMNITPPHHNPPGGNHDPSFYSMPLTMMPDNSHPRTTSSNTSTTTTTTTPASSRRTRTSRSPPTGGMTGTTTRDASPRRYLCQVCSKRFTRPSTLRTHMNSHTGERPFACPTQGCGWRFTVLSNLKRHMRICPPAGGSGAMGGGGMGSGVGPGRMEGMMGAIPPPPPMMGREDETWR